MSGIRRINRLSQLFLPIAMPVQNVKQPDTSAKSYENLTKYGLIKPVNNGMYALLPLGLRVMNKLIDLVDNEMENVGAQKLQLPALTSSKLWKATNRFESNKSELFKVEDRHNTEYILSPTYEELICKLISTVEDIPLKMLPLKLYQISNKWRDEKRPCHTFMRSREFLMKDLYTFDATLDNAKETYELICKAYDNIFQKIGIPVTKVIGDTGSIGGLMSHEYQYRTDIGEDIICICPSCHYSVNKIVCSESHCPQCKTMFLEQKTAEVGHAFLLDTKYTKPLKAIYKSQSNVTVPFAMGCYGLGLSRIFIVAVKTLSTQQELRWPKNLAPYTVCIIPPKSGSKEESASQYLNQIVEILNDLNIDTVLDDRGNLTIGKRLRYAQLIGYPYTIVIGKVSMQSPPLFEIHDINNSTQSDVPLERIHDYFQQGTIS